MSSEIFSLEADLKKRKRKRQILSCKNCKVKKVKCQPETNPDILNSLPIEAKANGNPCKQCIKRKAICEYFQRVDTKKEALQKERSRKKKQKLANSFDINDDKIPKPQIADLKVAIAAGGSFPIDNNKLLSLNENLQTAVDSSLDYNSADENQLTSNSNSVSVVEIMTQNKFNAGAQILPCTQDLLGYSIPKSSQPNITSQALTPSVFSPASLLMAGTTSTLKDLSNVVSNELKAKNYVTATSQQGLFANGLPNPMSPNNLAQFAAFTQQTSFQGAANINGHTHGHQHSTVAPYQQALHRHHNISAPLHPLSQPSRSFNILPQRTPPISSPPSSVIRLSQQKKQSPIEINSILKPLTTSPTASQLAASQQLQNISRPMIQQLSSQHEIPTLNQENVTRDGTPGFTEKYFASQTPLLPENPLRKLELYTVEHEAVFSCSAISVRPWFEHSKLVQKHQALFDNLRDKSHARRDKEKGSGVGSIKKDRMLILNSDLGNLGTVWEEIVKILPQMHVFREIIVAYFNSDLHLYFRILDRVSVFKVFDKYFETEVDSTADKNEDLGNEAPLNDKITRLKLESNDNFFNVAIVFQIYRIVMAKRLTEKEDDLFRQMEIYLNGISSGYIWSFTKLQFSLLCYLQRHLDLEMSDFGFNFKIMAEHIASTCVKTGLHRGIHHFITPENLIPEWTLKNLYLWSHYFDLIHALESGSPLIIPFDPIIEEEELKTSERGQDGLLRRFVLLGRRIINALYEPYGAPDFDGMFAKIEEFERLELLPMNSYCNLSTINNVDLYDYSVLIPLMNIKLTLMMLRFFVYGETATDSHYSEFFGTCFAILAIVIVLREQWQSSLQNKETILSFKTPLSINVDHLSYFHSLAVQRDLLDKLGITFYEMLYLLRTKTDESEEISVESNSKYSSDDILSHLISLILLKQALPIDLILKPEDLLKSFTILVERFYKIDTFGKEKQPNIHFKDFETIFRNIYTGNSSLEAALTPKFVTDTSQNQSSADLYPNSQVATGDSMTSTNPMWQKPSEEIESNVNANPPIPAMWTEEDVNIMQLFDVDFTTFLTPFL
ncbi:hypothetical protein QEN19_003857 [Hanseniaspora menglaensis]